MKRILLTLLLFLVLFLSSCSADMDEEPASYYEQMVYDYSYATFNNASTNDLTYNINDYEKEFYMMYQIAQTRDFTLSDLTENERTAYTNLFDKLEVLDNREERIFELSLSEFKDLLTSRSIEVTTSDILAFNAIKTLFDTFKETTISLTKNEFMELFLERELTDIEENSLEFVFNLGYFMTYENAINVPLEDAYTQLQADYGPLSDEEKAEIEITYNLLNSINKD